MASALTTSETVEWEGLLARNARGKIEPGSPEERRLRALTEGAEGKRDLLAAREPVREMSRAEQMDYYGIAQRCWYELTALGRKANDPVPWNFPADMPGWFARMRAMGRKHPPPGKIQLRADEARLGRVAPAGAPAAVEKPADPVSDPLHLGAAATTDDILLRYQRIALAIGLKYEEAAARGEIERARGWRAEMDTVTDRIRQWSLNAAKIREAEQWVRPEQFFGTLTDCALRLLRHLRAQLLTQLPPDTVEAALASLRESLPTLLPSELTPCLAVK